ncbi:hypothetical protein TNCV_4353471 [Trichonephila clavipes]|nr:hypothetical protein TNCV_4353471 [Trichonephila clavipes]
MTPKWSPNSPTWSPKLMPIWLCRQDFAKFSFNRHYNVTANVNVALVSYTKAFGDGPRHFEPQSSDENDTRAGTPLLTTTPHQREDVSALDRFIMHRCPTRRAFSGTGLELITRQP